MTRPEESLMRVVHVTAAVGRRSFGVGPIVLNLAREQRTMGLRSEIWSTDRDADIEFASESSGLDRQAIHGFPIWGPERLGFSPRMEIEASKIAPGGVQIVHQHGLWTMQARAVAQVRSRAKAAVVIAAHGSLQSWTLQHSRFKKRLASMLYERRGLESAACLHASAVAEVDDYRQWGLRNPIAVIPNGIDEAWLASVGDGKGFKEAYHIETGRRTMLFLSRIAKKKGLPMLLHALAQQPAAESDWILAIAGADERGHQREVEALVADLNLGERVRFVGELRGQLKRDAFAAADLFVLPSYSEGAPMVVLEALGAGLPVLTTTGSPWQELVTNDCGWWVAPTTEAIRAAVQEASGCSVSLLREMGQRGRSLVQRSYTWRRAGQMSVEIYEWLAGNGERPEFVVTS